MGAADELLTRYLVSERVTVHNGRQQTKNSMKVHIDGNTIPSWTLCM